MTEIDVCAWSMDRKRNIRTKYKTIEVVAGNMTYEFK
jgi:hypothetical protein